MSSESRTAVGLESRLRRIISRLGLLPVAFVVWRTLREWSPSLVKRNRDLRKRAGTGMPIPPDSMIFSSTGTRDVRWFLESGASAAGAFRAALRDLGRPMESLQSVLDFGCGCGRVIRHWADLEGTRICGCDYNPSVIEWDTENLRFAVFAKTELQPPLLFEEMAFDFCYSISVFTHLPSQLQRPWIEELHRVIRPGGILMLTLSGRGDFHRLLASDRERFDRGELVVLDADFAGTNMCGVYHPPEYVQREWSDLFTLLKHIPEGAKGSPNQDLFIFSRR
jgi:Methylase involved in ubiquinone/menaquinone biosynthesis